MFIWSASWPYLLDFSPFSFFWNYVWYHHVTLLVVAIIIMIDKQPSKDRANNNHDERNALTKNN